MQSETAAPAQPATGRTEIVFSVPTVVKALGIFFGIIVVVVVRDSLLAIALSIIFVLGLDPPVAALERRGWGRGKAALTIFALIALIAAVVVIWAARPVWGAISGFVDDLPKYIDEARNSGVLKDVDQGTDALTKAHSVSADAAKNLSSAAINLLGSLGATIGTAFQLVTLTFLTLFGLIAKPQLSEAGMELMRPEHAKRFARISDEVAHAISYTLIGNIVISVIAGTVVAVTAVIIGAPSPIVLGLIVGAFDLIPQVGSAIAAFVVCTITLIASGPPDAVILLIVILVYQQAENYLIQPAVMKQAVELSGFATIAVVILGSALLGVVGAVLAVPVAASVKIILRELTGPRRAEMAGLREGQVPVAPGT